MVADIEQIKKMIIYRSNYRGTKEMDKLLGSFVKNYIDKFTIEELKELEKFLDLDDELIYDFYKGKSKNIDFTNKKILNTFINFKLEKYNND
tara:strand:- start:519 stop:794 length:276 start_codon:yes stop_codon:yes gene_type:complete